MTQPPPRPPQSVQGANIQPSLILVQPIGANVQPQGLQVRFRDFISQEEKTDESY